MEDLKIRCLKSGYKKEMVEGILSQSDSLERILLKPISVVKPADEKVKIRLVILSGTTYQNEFTKFTLQSKSGVVKSVLKDTSYKVDKTISCNEGGIYIIQGVCSGQYTGETINFGNRCLEHFKTSKTSAIYDHMRDCQQCSSVKDFSVTYVESYLSRGKYSLSEREMLWNERIKGVMNVHKTLKSS